MTKQEARSIFEAHCARQYTNRHMSADACSSNMVLAAIMAESCVELLEALGAEFRDESAK